MIWLVLVSAAVGAGWLFGHGQAADNARTALAAAPADFLGLLLGANLGLLNRERVRLRRTFASPATAFLGKLLTFASLSGAATFVLSPVAWEPELFHAAVSIAALGTAGWLGNLPPKL